MALHEGRMMWDQLASDRRKLESIVNSFLTPITKKLTEQLLHRTQGRILDVATGTGEPGITLAWLNPALEITGIDISEKMLQVANQRSAAQGLTNYTTLHCDATSIPLPDNSMDAIICRNGIMFFMDLHRGLSEMYRVLKPGGTIHLSTWGLLSKNVWIEIILKTISEITKNKVYKQFVPGMFYCMEVGFITEWLEMCHFKAINESELTGVVSFNSPEEYWGYVSTVSAVVVDILKPLDKATIEQVKEGVLSKIEMHIVQKKIYFQWSSNIAFASK